MKIQNPIVHQQQPTPDACASACLAMILNEPVEKVMKEFHDDYKNGGRRPIDYLRHRKIPNIKRCYSDEWLNGLMEGVFLATVPSLNKQAILHSVVFDARDDLIVYDPNKGIPGKSYYTYEPKEVETHPYAVMLRGYVLEVGFEIKEYESRFKV